MEIVPHRHRVLLSFSLRRPAHHPRVATFLHVLTLEYVTDQLRIIVKAFKGRLVFLDRLLDLLGRLALILAPAALLLDNFLRFFNLFLLCFQGLNGWLVVIETDVLDAPVVVHDLLLDHVDPLVGQHVSIEAVIVFVDRAPRRIA